MRPTNNHLTSVPPVIVSATGATELSMGTAQRRGYETRETEENETRLPRVNDFKGGLPLPSTYMSEEQAA